MVTVFFSQTIFYELPQVTCISSSSKLVLFGVNFVVSLFGKDVFQWDFYVFFLGRCTVFGQDLAWYGSICLALSVFKLSCDQYSRSLKKTKKDRPRYRPLDSSTSKTFNTRYEFTFLANS